MSRNLMVVKLRDETIIYAKKSRVDAGRIVVSNLKFMKKNETPTYIEDEMAISEDAILVWFRVIKGDKEPVNENPGPYAPDPNPAA